GLDSTLTNNAGAMISGGKSGLRVSSGAHITGAVVNSGLIKGGTGDGIFAGNGGPGLNSTLTNNAGATISGGKSGLHVGSLAHIPGAVVNSGVIKGGTANGFQIRSGGSLGGALTNSGTISGAVTGLQTSKTSHVAGAVTNSGLVRGGTGEGIQISQTSS